MGVIIRQGFKASVSNYAGMILGFVSFLFLFPFFYTPKELGALRLFIEMGTIFSSFALMGTHYSINRFFPSFRTADQRHHGFFFWAAVLPLIGYMLLLIGFAFQGESIFLFINKNALQYRNIFPALLFLIFIILYQIVSEVSCANHGRTAVPNFMKEVVIRVLIIISGLAYYFKYISFSESIWLITGSYALALIGNIWFLKKLTKVNLKPDFHFIRKHPELKTEILNFTLLLFFSGIASLIYTKMDFLMISILNQDLSDVAIYSIGFTLAAFIEVPKRTILQIAAPIFSSLMKDEKFDEIQSLNKKNGSNQLLIAGILFFLIWLNIDNLYNIMPKGDFYSKGKWVVLLIGAGRLIDALTSGNGHILINSRYYSYIFFNTILAIITSVIYNYYFISEFGIIGGAISSVLVILTINIFNVVVVQHKLKINPFHKNQLSILIILTGFFLLSFTGHWLQNPYLDSVLRTLVFGPALIVCFYKAKVSDDFNTLLLSKIPAFKKS